jgi:hypothetical protein
MYTLEQLQQKSLKELKEIGFQLNVFPVADRRCRQNWIDAIVGVNPPLLQLLEFSPAASVFEKVQPIIETVETPSAVEVEPVQTLPIESKFCRIVYPWPVQKSIAQVVETSLGVEVDLVSELIAPAAEKFSGVERVTESNRKNFSGVERVTESNRNNFSGFERVQEPIVLAAKNFPGSRSKASIAHQLLELFQSRAHIIEDSPGVKTEATVSESAIAPAAKNPILTGVTFSDRFLARYAPPQAQIIHFQPDADGQLSLLNFEIESLDEPPDPDDFEFLDAFREALARWDCEHNEVSPEHKEPLQVSLESFCLWVPCPPDWYESAALLEPSSMLQLSQTRKSSITSDFFIPIFDAWCDRFNGSDEPPDTGIFAKLPKPNSPSFPPATVGQAQPKPQPTATQPQAKHIPNPYQTHTCCIVAGSSTQPARSPSGGDAGF